MPCADAESTDVACPRTLSRTDAIDASRPAPSSRHALLPLQDAPHSSAPPHAARPGGGRQRDATPYSVDGEGGSCAGGSERAAEAGKKRDVSCQDTRDVPAAGGGGQDHSSVDRERMDSSAAERGGGREEEGGIEQHYTVGRMLDGGSNGTVYAGIDKRTGEKVAIKIIDVEGGSLEGEGQKDIWLQVQHDNMVRLLDYYKTPSKLYFVMELATGVSYYRMCSLTIECVLLLQNLFSYFRVCSLFRHGTRHRCLL